MNDYAAEFYDARNADRLEYVIDDRDLTGDTDLDW